eukprot:214421-Chlamydomonas_euryale.AAC.1
MASWCARAAAVRADGGRARLLRRSDGRDTERGKRCSGGVWLCVVQNTPREVNALQRWCCCSPPPRWRGVWDAKLPTRGLSRLNTVPSKRQRSPAPACFWSTAPVFWSTASVCWSTAPVSPVASV